MKLTRLPVSRSRLALIVVGALFIGLGCSTEVPSIIGFRNSESNKRMDVLLRSFEFRNEPLLMTAERLVIGLTHQLGVRTKCSC